MWLYLKITHFTDQEIIYDLFALIENKIYASLSGTKQIAHINKDISYVFSGSLEGQFRQTGKICNVDIAICVTKWNKFCIAVFKTEF